MSTELSLDITEQIITTLWLSPLSPSDRATLIKSSHLVSKTWNAVFSRVAARDVYILSASHGVQFLDIVSRCGTSHSDGHLLDRLCRSITFEHERKYFLPGPRNNEQLLGRVISLILQEITASPNRLPRLRRIALMLKNFLMATIFDYLPFFHVPYQVRELDINFWYSAEKDLKAVQVRDLEGCDKFYIGRGSLPFIRRLRVKGAPRGVVQDLLNACGSKERLLVFEQDAWEEEQSSCRNRTLPSVYEDERFSDDEDTSEGEEEEEFYDCKEEFDRTEDIIWAILKSVSDMSLPPGFTKAEASRMLKVSQRHLAI
ncbi:hypothetical protein VNI00_007153 [Paramarasmius palmivorus]|uniref:F-box domain-containing protein n=1 Tax=Paramarasmius palmivorus TaxID=297713 RepID=A0AAW0D0V2_9AGAR